MTGSTLSRSRALATTRAKKGGGNTRKRGVEGDPVAQTDVFRRMGKGSSRRKRAMYQTPAMQKRWGSKQQQQGSHPTEDQQTRDPQAE